jgi:hypothetical protein
MRVLHVALYRTDAPGGSVQFDALTRLEDEMKATKIPPRTQAPLQRILGANGTLGRDRQVQARP